MKRTLMRALAGQIGRAISSPASRDVPARPLRALVGLPVVFDLTSLAMQAVDYRRTRRIADDVGVDDAHHRDVQDYNAGVTLEKVFTSTRRMDVYYRLLSLAGSVDKERLLIVGPRNRHELLSAWVHGFSWSNIEAIDLYSTHSKIAVMNMEEMTFADATFDAVCMSNTLSYAADTRQAIAEVARVLKPRGRFSFSTTYDPGSTRWKGDAVTATSIATMLHTSDFEISVHLAQDKFNSQGRRQTSHVFLTQKMLPGMSRADPFRL